MPKTLSASRSLSTNTLYLINHYEGISYILDTPNLDLGSAAKTSGVFRYPYLDFFTSYISEKDFLAEAMHIITKDYIGISTKLINTVIVDLKDHSTLQSSLSDDTYIACYLGLFTVGVSQKVISYVPTEFLNKSYVFTQSVLPNIVLNDVEDQVLRDEFYASVDIEFPDNSKILFTGGRLLQKDKEAYRLHLLTSLVSSPGYYNIFIDLYDTFCVSSLRVKTKPYHLIALLNDPTGIECLLDFEDGSKQLVDVLANDIFIIPLGNFALQKISVKGKLLGLREYALKRDETPNYIVLDCRNKKEHASSDMVKKYVDKLEVLKGAF